MITSQIIKAKKLYIGTTVEAVTASVDGASISATTDIALVTCDGRAKIVKLPTPSAFGLGKTLAIRVATPGTDVSFVLRGSDDTTIKIEGIVVGASGYAFPVTQWWYLTAISSTEWVLAKEDIKFENEATTNTATAGGGTTGLISALATFVRVTSGNARDDVTLPYAADFGVGRQITVSINGTGCHVLPSGSDTITAATIVDVTLAANRDLVFRCTGSATWQQVGSIITNVVS